MGFSKYAIIEIAKTLSDTDDFRTAFKSFRISVKVTSGFWYRVQVAVETLLCYIDKIQ